MPCGAEGENHVVPEIPRVAGRSVVGKIEKPFLVGHPDGRRRHRQAQVLPFVGGENNFPLGLRVPVPEQVAEVSFAKCG